MAKTQTLVTLIREIVKAEVQKEVKKIFIKENVKKASVKPKHKESKEVSYTKDPTLNKILNETAQSTEFDEYPNMGEYDTSNMVELLGYGEMPAGGDNETKRKVAAAQTAQAAGVDPNSVPEKVMGALTRDYRDVMKAIDKKKGN
tara:strand:+ start:34 stop:468 length:435 start_codon:yes stop_codon:yes gene_type:complete